MRSTTVTFYELMKESVIVQGLIALVCMIGTFALLITDKHVPDYVWILNASVISFFFGAKSLMSQRQAQLETARIMAQVSNEIVAQNLRGTPLGAAAESSLHSVPGLGWQHDDRASKFEKPLD